MPRREPSDPLEWNARTTPTCFENAFLTSERSSLVIMPAPVSDAAGDLQGATTSLEATAGPTAARPG